MKLVKIISRNDQDTGLFSVDFREPLNLKPMTKVALVNASFSIDSRQILVDDNNNTLQFKRKDSEDYFDVVIPTGSYTQLGFRRVLLQALSVVQTQITGGNNADSNFQWNIPDLVDGKIDLQFRRIGVESMTDCNLTSMNVVATGFQAAAGASPGNQYAHYAVAKKAFSNGTGVFSCEFRDSGGANVSDGVMGLMNTIPVSSTIQVSDISYGIKVVAVGNYLIIEDGIATDSGFAVSNDEAVRILLCTEDNPGKLVFQYEDAVNGWVTLGVSSTVFDFNSGSYFTCVGLTNPNTQVLECKYTSDPFYTTDLTQLKDSLSALQATKVTLLLSSGCAELLGFGEVRHFTTSLVGSFKATIGFIETNTPPSLTIEMPSIGEMNSFDSVSGDRRQILAVCPLSTSDTGLNANNLIYSPPHPIFVDLHNAFTTPITQMSVRILNSVTNEPVDLDGQGTSLCIAFTD